MNKNQDGKLATQGGLSILALSDNGRYFFLIPFFLAFFFAISFTSDLFQFVVSNSCKVTM
jgi:hypothetical protein